MAFHSFRPLPTGWNRHSSRGPSRSLRKQRPARRFRELARGVACCRAQAPRSRRAAVPPLRGRNAGSAPSQPWGKPAAVGAGLGVGRAHRFPARGAASTWLSDWPPAPWSRRPRLLRRCHPRRSPTRLSRPARAPPRRPPRSPAGSSAPFPTAAQVTTRPGS